MLRGPRIPWVLTLLLLGACKIPETDGPSGLDTDVDTEPPDTGPDFVDADGDGYGSSDCDDANAAIHPGAAEVCNGADDDCDGATDDADEVVDVSGGVDGHADVDGDGYGDPAVTRRGCAVAAGWVTDATDCDDADATVFPGAEEACDDVDQDCDGVASPRCDPAITGVHTLREFPIRIGGPADFGWDVASVGDIDGDGTLDVVVSGSAETTGLRRPGAAWALLGPFETSRTVTLDEAFARGDTDRSYVGIEVAPAGDQDGDGLADVLVGAAQPLGVAVVTAPVAGTAFADLSPRIGDATSLRDRGVAWIGDADGDGWDDVAIGDESADVGSPGGLVGRVCVYHGPITTARSCDDAEAVITGSGDFEHFGQDVVGAGDLDGDGVTELLAGATYGFGGAHWFSLFDADVTGTIDRADEDGSVVPVYASSAGVESYVGDPVPLGPMLSAAERDADGDGQEDLLLAGLVDNEITVGLFTSKPALKTTMSDAAIRFVGAEPYDEFVRAVWAGDLDQDGSADLALVDPGFSAGPSLAGAVALFYGPFTLGTHDVAAADAIVSGDVGGANAGAAVAPGGDLTGDGYPDLLVTAPGDSLGGTVGGVLWVLPGGY